ncbi:caspase family protein [Microseira wollei]|uniref:Peptidase C14, caspase catalytic subunit p20 n=1 Tax=Microseira wollei NIES-4236 TaxID=2530354 RepID=A0AAV3XLV1_9CYAN|nr:caspase family protein [Microseira wollei]GET41771.1 peptidase C14, caspase catalytic subunit p20 [Microseira wollei NIES-4236]
MKRRHFLQFSSSLLASLGISQLDLIHGANRYGKVLAQSTSRKLALLVGINNYNSGIRPLRGCLTDVEMQRELLIHRFGFNPKDLLEVTDTKATRSGMIAAFEEHLIKQAKPDDIVVFHFSGHGSRVIDPNPIGNKKLNSTLVPIDTITESPNLVRDIMGQTLFLLMSAVPTENLTIVLDSCYSGGGDRGNLVIRSARLDRGGDLQVSPEEFEYQQKWLKQLNLSPQEFQQRREKGIAKGVALTAAKDNQAATDAPFSGFSAGAFTYLLTRYLWQQTRNDTVGNIFVNLAMRTRDLAESSSIIQEPELEVKPGSNNQQKPLYFSEKITPGAEGIIRKPGNQIEFWLGGVASQSLEAFQAGSIFSLIDNQGKEIGQIEQQSRVGLVGYGKVIQDTSPSVIKDGVLLRERVRGIPTNLTLKLGLDEALGAEKAKAQTAITTVNRMEVVPIAQRGELHYILGRVTEEDLRQFQQQSISNPPPVGAVGLFTAGREPVIGSFGRVGESIEEAIQQRLRSQLRSLLAGRILRTLITGESSALKVRTTIKSIDNQGASGIVASRGNQESQIASFSQTIQFKPGTDIQIQIQNNEERNLYISAVLIDSSGNLVVLFPRDWDAPEDAALVAAGNLIAIPQPNDSFQFRLRGPSGTLEVLVLASVKPLRSALKGLQNIARSRNLGRGSPLGLADDEPVAVVDNLLGDLDEMTRAGIDVIPGGVQAVDTTQLAALSALIQVVE